MASYKLSELAEEDLRLISVRTIEDWGRSQAEKYVMQLHEAMTQIANTPAIGKNRPELFDSARSFPVEKHIVYYRNSNEGVEIARVLHRRMDALAFFM